MKGERTKTKPKCLYGVDTCDGPNGTSGFICNECAEWGDEECDECDGYGYVVADCFEDTCCCADPVASHGYTKCPACSGSPD